VGKVDIQHIVIAVAGIAWSYTQVLVFKRVYYLCGLTPHLAVIRLIGYKPAGGIASTGGLDERLCRAAAALVVGVSALLNY
jgi:hypothetical protein